MKRQLIASSICLSLVAAGCSAGTAAGPGAKASTKADPTERYLAALDRKVDGDSKGYFDELIALAHDEPDSRAGRRARATLQGDGLLTAWVMAGAIAAIAVPSFTRFSGASKQSEAQAALHGIFSLQREFFAERGRYCRTFAECSYVTPPGGRYAYFLSAKEVAGVASSVKDPLAKRGLEALGQAGVVPKVQKASFVAAAAGNLDDDETLDLWVIDETGELKNLQSDLER